MWADVAVLQWRSEDRSTCSDTHLAYQSERTQRGRQNKLEKDSKLALSNKMLTSHVAEAASRRGEGSELLSVVVQGTRERGAASAVPQCIHFERTIVLKGCPTRPSAIPSLHSRKRRIKRSKKMKGLYLPSQYLLGVDLCGLEG